MTESNISTTITQAIAAAGGDTAFGIPGGGNNLDFIGAAESAGMRFILTHAETPAVIMAAVYADMTGRPTACVVTRGPGAASAVNGAANAQLDRQPVILVTDAVSAEDWRCVPHQRIDQRALYAPVVKWSATVGIEGAESLSDAAIAVSSQPPRGPVHLDFDPSARSTKPVAVADAATVPRPDLEEAVHRIEAAQHPVIVAGIGALDSVEEIRSFVTHLNAPTLMTYRAKGVVPDTWPQAAGLFTGATTEAPLLEQADLIVMVGVDSVELIPAQWNYRAPVLNIASWADDSSYIAESFDLIASDLSAVLTQLTSSRSSSTWAHGAGNAHRDLEIERLLSDQDVTHGLAPQAVVSLTRAAAPPGTVATVDAGAHMLPAMMLWSVGGPHEVLISSGLATMGYAIPAAIAAALARPNQRIVAFTGDGGLGMCVAELETIARLNLPITVVVFNDSRLTLIALKAKPANNGGNGAIAYDNVNFAQVASGFGLDSVRVTDDDSFTQALVASFASDKASLIDVTVDPAPYPHILRAVRGKRD